MWSGSGSEHTRSIIGLNFKGGPSVAPNLADAGTQGLGVKDDGGRFKAGVGHLIKKDSSEFSGIL